MSNIQRADRIVADSLKYLGLIRQKEEPVVKAPTKKKGKKK